MSRSLVCAFLLSVLAVPVRADVVEVPLSGLLGPYPISENETGRTVVFHLPDPPSEIYGVSFRLSGIHNMGSITCEWGGPYDWPMVFEATMNDGQGAYWFAEDFTMPAGEFSWTLPFTHIAGNSPTWDFLLDGSGEIMLYGYPAGLVGLCFEDPVEPSGVITEAVLLVDGEFPIAVETSTWGRIKALYR